MWIPSIGRSLRLGAVVAACLVLCVPTARAESMGFRQEARLAQQNLRFAGGGFEQSQGVSLYMPMGAVPGGSGPGTRLAQQRLQFVGTSPEGSPSAPPSVLAVGDVAAPGETTPGVDVTTGEVVAVGPDGECAPIESCGEACCEPCCCCFPWGVLAAPLLLGLLIWRPWDDDGGTDDGFADDGTDDGADDGTDDGDIPPVSEPGTLVLLGAALAGLAATRRRRRKRPA